MRTVLTHEVPSAADAADVLAQFVAQASSPAYMPTKRHFSTRIPALEWVCCLVAVFGRFQAVARILLASCVLRRFNADYLCL